jgi:outer membrane protein OmpA-like peptidoglycan-associated protein
MTLTKEFIMFPRTTLSSLAVGLSVTLLACAAGCSATVPPPELVSARSAYARVQVTEAQQLVPAEVLAAHQALLAAEKAYEEDPGSARARDLGYIAQRRAQLAEARAAIAADQRDGAQAEKDVDQLRRWDEKRTKTALSETRAEVSAQRSELAVRDQQLTAEQRARHAAEKRAADALASLRELAAVKEEERGMVITLNGAVLFVTNQATLLPIARDRLQQVADALADTPQGNIVVEGYTDSTGTQSLNEDLSQRRAEAVRTFLVEHGIESNRIRARGYGPARPVADNKTPEGRANNRRVEIVVEKIK